MLLSSTADTCPSQQHQGARVRLLATHRARGKLRRFLDALVASGAAQPWTRGAPLSEESPGQRGQQGLQEAAAAAGAVRRALAARRAALGLAA
jgi:hypothetical protein